MVDTFEDKATDNIVIERLPEEGITIRASVPIRLQNRIRERFEGTIKYAEISIRDVYGALIRRALNLPQEEFDNFANCEDGEYKLSVGTHFHMPTDISKGLDRVREERRILKKEAFLLALRVGFASL